MDTNRGFSLVELSIVLVILGLLTGGILSGQSLIRAAELRTVSTDMVRYRTAAHAFRDKYFMLPGDLNNATRFWGDDNTNCPDAAVTNGTPGTCNGDGDGTFDNAIAVSTTGELFQFWKQLALAGLIEGTYSGLTGSGSLWHAILGTNVPQGRISSSGYSVWWWADYNASNANSNVFYGNYGNMIGFGASAPNGVTDGGILKPEEAWNIDTKMDNGKPGSGSIMMRVPLYTYTPSCTTGVYTDPGSATYTLTSTSPACSVLLKFGS